jgi:hypothetical protein
MKKGEFLDESHVTTYEGLKKAMAADWATHLKKLVFACLCGQPLIGWVENSLDYDFKLCQCK